MEYFRITKPLQDVYSHYRNDFTSFSDGELLTKRELDSYYRAGYRIPVNALERVYTPQKNVRFVCGMRVPIDKSKVKT